MKRTVSAWALLFGWIIVLAGLGWSVQRNLVIGTDLRLFLPSARNAEQQLLLDKIGEGPASRMLVLAIEGGTPEGLADASRELVSALSDSRTYRVVTNGEASIETIPEDLLAYRYLLSDTLDHEDFDAEYLRGQLQARARDLASPAGGMLEPLVPRDPTLEALKLLQSWQPLSEPNRRYDVWFDQAGERALLMVETVAPAFDAERQREAIGELREAFDLINTDNALQLTISGPGEFSVLMEQRTRREAQTLGIAASAGMLALLFLGYRRFGSVVLSALPLLTAGVAGLLAVSLIFDAVHGITLAFGFTLIGVAQDYPLHLLSHARPGHAPHETARELWPTLRTGVASTCIAYATFLFSGVVGLVQLACFTVAALAAAGLTTRFLLPVLMGEAVRDFGQSARLGALWDLIASVPRRLSVAGTLAMLCIAVLVFAPYPMWQNDLSKLSPLPPELLVRDQEIRSQLGTPDLRYLLVIESTDDAAALQTLESLHPALQDLTRRGAILGFDDATRYVPTAERQRARQQRLPDEAALRAALDRALEDTPFRQGVFEAFVNDVDAARKLPPLTAQQLRDSPLGSVLDLLLTRQDERTLALVTFNGVRDPQALRELAGQGVVVLDLKGASESLIAQQRTHLLWSLAAAAVMLVAVIAVALRRFERVMRVLMPMGLTTLIVLAVLHGSGVPLTLFHLIALILAAGLGLDYALFFERAADDPLDQRRTLHAVLLCSIATLMVFALLALSTLPVLRAIGITVSIGVVCNFFLALLLTRKERA